MWLGLQNVHWAGMSLESNPQNPCKKAIHGGACLESQHQEDLGRPLGLASLIRTFRSMTDPVSKIDGWHLSNKTSNY